MEAVADVSPSLPITERLVARLWEEQHPFRLPLATTDGREIQVVYRGRRRWDRGPDFCGAMIAWPGSRLEHGDVEIHVRSADWRAHGHHRDAHYNGVILQVVLWDNSPGPLLRQDGFAVPVVALAAHLSRPLESLAGGADSGAPVPSPCWRGPQEDGALGELLERCGLRRFGEKATRWESDLGFLPPEQLLYEGIADALGYSQNRAPFRRLAGLLPLETAVAFHSREPATHRVESLLLGAAGLLPSQRGLEMSEDPHVAALEAEWAAEGAEIAGRPMHHSEWQFFRVRPANFPTRRVAALAELVERWPREGLAERLVALARSTTPRAIPRALESLLLRQDPSPYWREYCDFGYRLRRPGNPIGRQRAAEIAVNVFLPFTSARASLADDDTLARLVREAYLLYPKRGDNEITRYLAVQIAGLARPRVARSACRQQGLLHLYYGWCEAKRCGECPVQTARPRS